MIVSLTGNDTVTIDGRIFNNFGDGAIAELVFDNDLAVLKTGKNGNTIYALNNTGRQVMLTLRLLRGSSDDQYLNAKLLNQNTNFAGFTLMVGEFIKNIGDGAGNIQLDAYILSGGIFKRQVGASENSDGDTNQSIAVWTLQFSNGPRAIG